MTEEEKPAYSKGSSVDLRIILIGDVGVGKKSIIQRFKLINSTETHHINFQGFFRPKKKKITKKSKKSKKRGYYYKIKKRHNLSKFRFSRRRK